MATCSRCHKCDARAGHRWCKKCHASYMRGYRKIAKANMLKRAFGQGASAVRDAIAGKFQSMGLMEMNAVTAAEIARQVAQNVSRETYTLG